jgi:tRNA pseudouridine55 synthase
MNNYSADGILLIDKDSGPTSHDVVYKLRKILKIKQIGHAGTLDPLASGLIIALIGEGTKLSPFITDGDKGYQVTVRLGVTSDTQDRMGSVTARSETRIPLRVDVEAALFKASGPLQLPVPSYSAVKVNGRKLYDYARAGEATPEILRTMDFLQVRLVSYEYPLIVADLRCSKGSFVRAWASYVGDLLATGGLVEELRRTFSEPFLLENALTLNRVQEVVEAQDGFGSAFYPLVAALENWGEIFVAGEAERLVLNGQIPHSLNPAIFKLALAQKLTNGLRIISETSGSLLAIATPSTGGVGVKIHRVFPVTGSQR